MPLYRSLFRDLIFLSEALNLNIKDRNSEQFKYLAFELNAFKSFYPILWCDLDILKSIAHAYNIGETEQIFEIINDTRRTDSDTNNKAGALNRSQNLLENIGSDTVSFQEQERVKYEEREDAQTVILN